MLARDHIGVTKFAATKFEAISVPPIVAEMMGPRTTSQQCDH